MSVYPADLDGSGLVLYSANMKYAKDAVETPGPQNGWNRTTYRWDPHHAKRLAVTEAPGPGNNWSRLVVQSRNNVVSVIVIDWTVQ